MQNDLLISPGSHPGPITISRRNDCVTLTGTVHSERQNALVFIVLVPDVVEGASIQISIVAAKGFTRLNGVALGNGKSFPGAMVLLLP